MFDHLRFILNFASMKEKYIVSFPSVYSDTKESWERDQIEEAGIVPLSYEREKDFIGTTAINMSLVLGYCEGIVSYNGQDISCMYLEIKPDVFTRNILIKREELDMILGYVNNTVVFSSKELIKTLKEEEDGSTKEKHTM